MKQQFISLIIILLLSIFPLCIYSQPKQISSRYQIERVNMELNADKKERFSYYRSSDLHKFNQLLMNNHLIKLSADNSIFSSYDSQITFNNQIMNIFNCELSKKEKKGLKENHISVFVKTLIDNNGHIIFVELHGYGLLEQYISPKHLSNILSKVNNLKITHMNQIANNGYVEITIIRRPNNHNGK